MRIYYVAVDRDGDWIGDICSDKIDAQEEVDDYNEALRNAYRPARVMVLAEMPEDFLP